MLALICAESPLDEELASTMLWRSNVERHQSFSVDEAKGAARQLRPGIVLVDRDLPGAFTLVKNLRGDPDTRALSIAALARGEFVPTELSLLQAGINAVLRLPPGPDWDERLFSLMHVPFRKEARVGVNLQVDAGFGASGESFSAVALNLSVNGLLIDSRQPLQVGDDLKFVFELPDHPGPISGTGTVVRHGGGPTQYGVELTHVQSDGRQRIRRWVEAL